MIGKKIGLKMANYMQSKLSRLIGGIIMGFDDFDPEAERHSGICEYLYEIVGLLKEIKQALEEIKMEIRNG